VAGRLDELRHRYGATMVSAVMRRMIADSERMLRERLHDLASAARAFSATATPPSSRWRATTIRPTSSPIRGRRRA
jgi:N-methylhydantoinase B/oxoprolinase/acetone carboxylase alpha subunit